MELRFARRLTPLCHLANFFCNTIINLFLNYHPL